MGLNFRSLTPAGRGNIKGLKTPKLLKKGSSMVISSQMTSSSQSNSAVQGVQGHHHHPKKGIGDMISNLESAIDDATKSGKLTSDQASALTTMLDDIKKMLSQTQSGGASMSSPTGTSHGRQTGGATQLSADDRDKIRKELHEVGKQLFQALNAQSSASSTQQSSAASSTRQSNGVDAIFKVMDTNSDNAISKGELTSFLSNQTSNAANANGLVSSSFTYSQQATLSISRTQSMFTTMA
jgi:hypothetical protein